MGKNGSEQTVDGLQKHITTVRNAQTHYLHAFYEDS